MTDTSSAPATYLDPAGTVADRVADLLGRMTLREKVGQMLQLDARGDLEDVVVDKTVGSVLHASPERLRQAHDLTDRTRLRIPLLVGEDCIHGHSFFHGATIYPTQLGLAATWDPDLVERVARATAVEVASTGVHWTFSPVLCIARDLRWGRVGETFGEDPHLIGELAAAMVRGYQGEGLTDPTAILACAKHFAGYSETQGGRDASEADISRRKLRSWFLPPFERVARAGCRTFMLGYQTMDGVPITVNGWLLDDVLRGEWGYGGMLVTDWDNVGRMVWEQQVQPDHAHAAAAAVRAGNDLVMTTPQFFQGALDAVDQGLLTEADLDPAVARILTVKMELGLFEDVRRPDVERQRLVVGSAEHAELNLEVARRSVVLLRNDGTLPAAGRRSRAARRGGRPTRRRRPDPARRLGGQLGPGRLAARRPPARDDHDRPGRRCGRTCRTAGPSRTPAVPRSSRSQPIPRASCSPTGSRVRRWWCLPSPTSAGSPRRSRPRGRPMSSSRWSATGSSSSARAAPPPPSSWSARRWRCSTRWPPPGRRSWWC